MLCGLWIPRMACILLFPELEWGLGGYSGCVTWPPRRCAVSFHVCGGDATVAGGGCFRGRLTHSAGETPSRFPGRVWTAATIVWVFTLCGHQDYRPTDRQPRLSPLCFHSVSLWKRNWPHVDLFPTQICLFEEFSRIPSPFLDPSAKHSCSSAIDKGWDLQQRMGFHCNICTSFGNVLFGPGKWTKNAPT